jgi:hypothetical protein
MILDRGCFERGCACYDERVDKDGIEVIKEEWVGLTDEEVSALLWKLSLGAVDEDVRTIEAKLKEKNT